MNVAAEVRAIWVKLNELWKLVISMRASGGGGGGTHNLLSNTHPDTTTAAAQRGDLIYSDAAGSWKRLAKGSSGQVLQGDGTDTKWGSIPAHKTQHQAGGSDVVDADTLDGSHAAAFAAAAHHTAHESGGGDAIKLDDLATPDDNTDLNASSSRHGLLPKLTNTGTKWLRDDGTYQPLTAGGSNLVKLWRPDAFPTSPAAQCDHFDDSSIAAKWTAFQSHAALTVTEEDTFLKLVDTGNGAATHNLRGYFQALPAGDCVIACRLGFIPDMSNEQGAFLALFDDATGNPNTTSIQTLGLYCVGSTAYILVSSWGNYTTFGSNPYSYTGGWVFMPYLRFRRSGTTWFADHSMDGLNWYRNWTSTEAALGWTPSEMGILVDNRTAANTLTLWVDWFYYSGSHSISPPGSTPSFWIT